LPREVFFFGFGFAGRGFPSAAARAFCFLVVTSPPISLLTQMLPSPDANFPGSADANRIRVEAEGKFTAHG
jgi:hypothetical protein